MVSSYSYSGCENGGMVRGKKMGKDLRLQWWGFVLSWFSFFLFLVFFFLFRVFKRRNAIKSSWIRACECVPWLVCLLASIPVGFIASFLALPFRMYARPFVLSERGCPWRETLPVGRCGDDSCGIEVTFQSFKVGTMNLGCLPEVVSRWNGLGDPVQRAHRFVDALLDPSPTIEPLNSGIEDKMEMGRCRFTRQFSEDLDILCLQGTTWIHRISLGISLLMIMLGFFPRLSSWCEDGSNWNIQMGEKMLGFFYFDIDSYLWIWNSWEWVSERGREFCYQSRKTMFCLFVTLIGWGVGFWHRQLVFFRGVW